MKIIKTLALLLMSGMLFISCEKEYSVENGGSAMAAGTLKAAGSGECLPSSVTGVFTANRILTSANYIDVTVNFTAVGIYSITTDVVNGYSFRASGFATATGDQIIRLKGTGTPTAAGANTFTVKFGSSSCNIVVDVLPAGTGNAVLTVDCAGVVLGGTYKQNVAMTAANTATINVVVATAGAYDISTDEVNGVTFHATGFFTAGSHTLTLRASGTPTAAGIKTYKVTSGTSNCSFNVDYASGTTTPPASSNPWSFKVGSTTYSGTTGISSLGTSTPAVITIVGVNPAGERFILTLVNSSSTIAVGVYPDSFATSANYSSVLLLMGANPFSFTAGIGGNITTTVTEYNTSTRIIEGTFSGTAKTGDNPSLGTVVNVEEGKFKAAFF